MNFEIEAAWLWQENINHIITEDMKQRVFQHYQVDNSADLAEADVNHLRKYAAQLLEDDFLNLLGRYLNVIIQEWDEAQ